MWYRMWLKMTVDESTCHSTRTAGVCVNTSHKHETNKFAADRGWSNSSQLTNGMFWWYEWAREGLFLGATRTCLPASKVTFWGVERTKQTFFNCFVFRVQNGTFLIFVHSLESEQERVKWVFRLHDWMFICFFFGSWNWKLDIVGKDNTVSTSDKKFPLRTTPVTLGPVYQTDLNVDQSRHHPSI